MSHDPITEMLFGDSALRVTARMILMPSRQGNCLFAGSILPCPDIEDKHGEEMWECEIFIRPVRKYKGYKYSGARIDQMLTDGFGNPKNWDRAYWEADHET